MAGLEATLRGLERMTSTCPCPARPDFIRARPPFVRGFAGKQTIGGVRTRFRELVAGGGVQSTILEEVTYAEFVATAFPSTAMTWLARHRRTAGKVLGGNAMAPPVRPS